MGLKIEFLAGYLPEKFSESTAENWQKMATDAAAENKTLAVFKINLQQVAEVETFLQSKYKSCSHAWRPSEARKGYNYCQHCKLYIKQ